MKTIIAVLFLASAAHSRTLESCQEEMNAVANGCVQCVVNCPEDVFGAAVGDVQFSTETVKTEASELESCEASLKKLKKICEACKPYCPGVM